MDRGRARSQAHGMTTPELTKSWNAAEYDRTSAFVALYGESVLQALAPQAGERILDLGCGTGSLTAKIAELGADVLGIDQDAEMISRAQSLYPRVRFACADGHQFRQPRGEMAFDAVFSNAALHWMLRPSDVITTVREALRPGGRFVAEAGGHGNLLMTEQALHQARTEAGAPPKTSPWFFPSIATYARLLEDGGLEPRWMQIHDRMTPLPPGEGGLFDWMNMFATPLLDDLSLGTRAQVLDRAAELLRPELFADGRWSIDYRRLRFVAVRIH